MFRLSLLILTLFTSLAFAEGGLRWDHGHSVSSQLPKAADGLTAVWWNIEHGLTNDRVGDNALGHNLVALAEDAQAPDVIALGEYRESSVDPATREKLKTKYREIFFPYNPQSQGMGIMVYAKKGVEVDKVDARPIDWVPPGMKPDEEAAYRARWAKNFPDWVYFTRTYNRIRLRRGDRVLNLVPVHLIQPWEKIKQDYGPVGTVAATLALYLGHKNPMMYQVANLRRELEHDFGEKLDREPLMIVGDMNLTRRAPAYRLLSRLLEKAFPKSVATFPSRDASRHGLYPRLQIDHAFVSAGVQVREARVLPLKGSDHYALGVSVGGPVLECPIAALRATP